MAEEETARWQEQRRLLLEGCISYSAHYLGSMEISNVEGAEDCRRAMIASKVCALLPPWKWKVPNLGSYQASQQGASSYSRDFRRRRERARCGNQCKTLTLLGITNILHFSS